MVWRWLAFALVFPAACTVAPDTTSAPINTDRGETQQPAPPPATSEVPQPLNQALRDALEKRDHAAAVSALAKLAEAGAALGDMPDFQPALNLIFEKTQYLPAGRDAELVGLWAPLAKALPEPFVHLARAYLMRGLFAQGKENEAAAVWDLCKSGIPDRFRKHYGHALACSPRLSDRETAATLARTVYDQALAGLDAKLKGIKVDDALANAQMRNVQMDDARKTLLFCMAAAGCLADESKNPLLALQPPTTISFREVGVICQGKRVALADMDGDGDPDLLVPGQGLWRNQTQQRNRGAGSVHGFMRVDNALGIDAAGRCGGFADVNNDGRPDVVLAGDNSVSVFLQQDGGAFRRVERASDATVAAPEAIGFFDGDLDGRIDIYLAHYEGGDPDGPGQKDLALRGAGDGTFVDVSAAWGMADADRNEAGRGISPADYDGDGRTDVYVSNYRLCRNLLWKNTAGSGKGEPRLVECAAEPQFASAMFSNKRKTAGSNLRGVSVVKEATTLYGHTIGSAWGDMDGNGQLDLVTCNLAHPRFITEGFSDLTRLYLNTGASFADNSLRSGIVFCETHSDPLLADFNNDGNLDLSITCTYKEFSNQMYEGRGDGSFAEVTCRTGALAFNGWGQAAADYDGDGDLDWFVCDGNRGVVLFENTVINVPRLPPGANWAQFHLVGGQGVNTMALGAAVHLTAGKRRLVTQVFGGRGTSSFDDPVAHFGLGQYSGAVDVMVMWGNGVRSTHKGLAANMRHTLVSPAKSEPPKQK